MNVKNPKTKRKENSRQLILTIALDTDRKEVLILNKKMGVVSTIVEGVPDIETYREVSVFLFGNDVEEEFTY